MEFFNREVKKDFKGIGTFTGKVVDFRRDLGYRVEYEDGDSEDMTEKELMKWLTKPPGHPAPEAVLVKSQLAKRAAPASTTLAEFVHNTRCAARRKRKHTELKRSGVLEARRLKAEQAAAAAAAAAEAVRSRPALHPPPPWAEGLCRDGRLVRCDGALPLRATDDELDCSLYRLELEVHSNTSISVRWWYPPANPGFHNSWIGLFRKDSVTWHAEHGEVDSGSAKLAWKMLTSNEKSGSIKFGKLPKGIPDGEYVYTLQIDYGVRCRAVSETFAVRGGLITCVNEGGLVTGCSVVTRKQRQLGASLGLITDRQLDKDAEILDERCYFPVTAVDVVLSREYMDSHPMLKAVYRIVDKEAFLDWGLTSDYNINENSEDHANVGDHRLRARQSTEAKQVDTTPELTVSSQYSSILPSAAQHAKRFHDGTKGATARGLGGGTLGSEGYGEATPGSVHKIGIMLKHLRQLVLQDLQDLHWGMLWDLGPHSSFLDIGSGYGKIVLHLRLLSRMRVSVGVECVASRDAIAKKAMLQLEMEAAKAGETAPQSGSSADGEPSSPSTTDVCADPSVAFVPRSVFSGVSFEHADATRDDFGLNYTHIYIFDWVFSKGTLQDFAKVLQTAPFYILISFRSCTEWWSYGLTKIQPVAKLPGFRTSGKESMTGFVYINMEKVPTA